jgi:hypothetical protein
MHQGELKSWSDDQDKHRLALLTPRRRAEQHSLLPAGADPHNSAMQHYPGLSWLGQFRVSERAPSDGGGPGISRPYLVPYPRHQNPAAPERPPPGGMR